MKIQINKLCLFLFIATIVSASEPLRIRFEQLDDYWLYSPKKTPNVTTIPQAVIVATYTEICHRYELTIDETGSPVQYRLIATEPQLSAEHLMVLKAWTLFVRYEPGKKNRNGKSVNFRADVRWWNPDNPATKNRSPSC